MLCLQCKKEFKGRADAKCCSSSCRKKYQRLSVTSEEISVTNVTDKLSVTKPLYVNPDFRCGVASPDANATKEERELFIRILDHYDEETPVKQFSDDKVAIPR